MEQIKYDQLWDEIILKAIDDFISKHSEYELAVSKDKLKKDIQKAYEEDYKPMFKYECMASDSDGVDSVKCDDGKDIIIDRHKVAALLYLSIVSNNSNTFLRIKNKPDQKSKFNTLACHRIAYSVSLNCIASFIEEFHRQSPNNLHINKFLNNKGFEKSPSLICEKYLDGYKESIIPRMLWATEEISLAFESYTVSSGSVKKRSVSANANMLANIFYFLELHSAS